MKPSLGRRTKKHTHKMITKDFSTISTLHWQVMSWSCIACGRVGQRKALDLHIREDHLKLQPSHTNFNGFTDRPCGAEVRVDDFIRRKRRASSTQTKRSKADEPPQEELQQKTDEATLKFHFFMREPVLAAGVHSAHALGQWERLHQEASANLTDREKNLFPAPVKLNADRRMSLAQQVMYRSAKMAIDDYTQNAGSYDSYKRTTREHLYSRR